MTAHKLTLSDVTANGRTGYRGRNIVAWLKTHYGIEMPPVNQAAKTQGLLVVRLSQTEILLLEDNAPEGTIKSVSNEPGIYNLPRQDSHSCFMLQGEACAELFAKLCAVDLRTHKFPDLHVAQTSVARSSAIIIRRDVDTPAYLLLMDSSYAEYLWECLVDAIQEFAPAIEILK